MPILDLVFVLLLGINVIMLLITKGKREVLKTPLALLALIFVSVILLEVITEIFFTPDENNLFLYHIHNPLEYTLYSFFYYKLILSGKVRRLILISLPLYVLFSFYLSFFVQGFVQNNDYQMITEGILIICFSLLHIRQLILYNIEDRVQFSLFFWIDIGICIYFIGMLFLEGSLTDLLKIDVLTAQKYYKIGFAFKYMMCLLVLAGLMIGAGSKPIKIQK